MSCGVGCRHGSDHTLLWLWCRLAAVPPIRSQAWELSYATSVALKAKKKKKKKFFAMIATTIKALEKKSILHLENASYRAS